MPDNYNILINSAINRKIVLNITSNYKMFHNNNFLLILVVYMTTCQGLSAEFYRTRT
jgi:hypothetical protein